MKEIQLTQGYVAVVDDEDFELVSQYGWYAKFDKLARTPYARTDIRVDCVSSKFKQIAMHRFIMNAPKGTMVDHRDENGLNNQRDNLRFATRHQNGVNQAKKSSNSSGYKGVSTLHRLKVNPHVAYIYKNRQRYHLGYFATAKEAALAYNKAAIELHGEFANLNMIEDD